MNWPSKRQWIGIGIGAVLIAHFFIVIGTDRSWLALFASPDYYTELFFITLIAGIAVTTIVVQHNYWQVRLPFTQNFFKRLAAQTATGVALPAVFTFFLTWLYMAQVIEQDIAKSTFFIYEFPISILANVVINLMLLVDVIRQTQTPRPSAPINTLLVSKGQRQVPIPVDQIAYIGKENDFGLLTTRENEQFSVGQSLEQLESQLDPKIFFRANRQTIIHRAMCDHFVPDRSGKITLYLKAPLSREVSISQKRAADFRVWLTQ